MKTRIICVLLDKWILNNSTVFELTKSIIRLLSSRSLLQNVTNYNKFIVISNLNLWPNKIQWIISILFHVLVMLMKVLILFPRMGQRLEFCCCTLLISLKIILYTSCLHRLQWLFLMNLWSSCCLMKPSCEIDCCCFVSSCEWLRCWIKRSKLSMVYSKFSSFHLNQWHDLSTHRQPFSKRCSCPQNMNGCMIMHLWIHMAQFG